MMKQNEYLLKGYLREKGMKKNMRHSIDTRSTVCMCKRISVRWVEENVPWRIRNRMESNKIWFCKVMSLGRSYLTTWIQLVFSECKIFNINSIEFQNINFHIPEWTFIILSISNPNRFQFIISRDSQNIQIQWIMFYFY